MTARLIVGIDPGLMGAMCWMDANTGEVLDVADLPIHLEGKRKSIDAVGFMELISTHPTPRLVVVELVGARPTDSKTGAHTFGRNVGAIEALVLAAHLPMTRVAPVPWRRAAGLPAGAEKNASLAAALRLHPSARPHLEGKLARHDRGDAVLIASWGLSNVRHGVTIQTLQRCGLTEGGG